MKGAIITVANGNRDLKIFPLANNNSLAYFKSIPYAAKVALEPFIIDNLDSQKRIAANP